MLFPFLVAVAVAHKAREQGHVHSLRSIGHPFVPVCSLAGLIDEMGYVVTGSKQAFMALVDLLPNLSAQNIAQAVGLLSMNQGGVADNESLDVHNCFMAVCTNTKQDTPMLGLGSAAFSPSSWNADIFVTCINERYTIDWREVIRSLDYPEFRLTSGRGLAAILNLYKRATGEPMPVDPLFGKWQNRTGQLQLLQQLPSAPPDLIDWSCSGAPNIRQVWWWWWCVGGWVGVDVRSSGGRSRAGYKV